MASGLGHDSQSWCLSESNISRSGRSWRHVEAGHRYTVGTLQLGFARDFFLRIFLGVWIIHNKNLRKVLPEGEVPQNLFKHFPNADKVFMEAPKNHNFHRKPMFLLDFKARTL